MNFKLRLVRNLIVEVITLQLMCSNIGITLIRKINYRRFWKNLRNSNFYRDYKIFDKLPLGDKSLLMGHFEAINTLQLNKEEAFNVGISAERGERSNSVIGDITIGLSSGTSGNRGIFLVSPIERAQWVASVVMRVIGFQRKKRSVAFFLRANSELYESVKSNLLEFVYYNIFTQLDIHWKELENTQPDIIVAQPSVIKQLILISKANHCPWNVQKIISVAEVLTEEDEKYISQWAKIPVHQVYQCTEGFLAHTCKKGNLHWNSDSIIIEKEWLNSTQYLPRITDLKRTTQPIVRYKMNDIITEGACSCNLKSEVIAHIDGRMDDVFEWTDRNGNMIQVFPDFLRRTIVFAHDQIKDYSLVKSGEDVSLWVDGGSECFESAKLALEKLLLQKKVKTTIYSRDAPWTSKNGKRKRIVVL